MKRPTNKHIEAVERTIRAKQTAFSSRHIPVEIRKQIGLDIDLMIEIRQVLYHVMDKQPLYTGRETHNRPLY